MEEQNTGTITTLEQQQQTAIATNAVISNVVQQHQRITAAMPSVNQEQSAAQSNANNQQ